MTAKPNLVLLTVITLTIGIVLAVFGGIFLFEPPVDNAPTSQNLKTPIGFAFAATATLVHDSTIFNLYYDDIDAAHGTINTTLRLTFQCKEIADNEAYYDVNTMYLLLQIPAQIETNSLTVNYNRDYQDPQYWGGKFYCQNSNLTDKAALVIVEIPVENFSYGALNYLAFNFKMKDAFTKIDQSTYQLDISFTTNLKTEEYTDLQEIRPIGFRDSLVFRWSSRANFYVEQPANRYSISQFMPLSDAIHYYDGNTHYDWDVKALSSTFGSDSIILTIEDNSAKDKASTRESTAWLLLGLGVPTIISAFIEYNRERSKKIVNYGFKVIHFKNKAILAMVSFLLILVISLLVWYLYLVL